METLLGALRVSLDVGCHSHRVAVGLSNGEVLDEFDVKPATQGFDLFFDRIDSHQRRYGGEVMVAMEGYNGWAPYAGRLAYQSRAARLPLEQRRRSGRRIRRQLTFNRACAEAAVACDRLRGVAYWMWIDDAVHGIECVEKSR